MAYKYHYTGELDIHLPTVGINAIGGDTEKVYEASEPINHPEFVLVDREQAEVAPTEPEQPQEQAPQEEAQQAENVSEGETAQVE